jgi:hypothetical protein
MSIEIYLIFLIAGFVVLYRFLPQAAGNYLKFRGKRVITCPETRKAAGVEVDAAHAAITGGIGNTDLRLKSCSRWPERQDCGQACLLQVRLAPEDCLLRNILTGWYADKHCVSCGTPFGEIHLYDHKPALLSPEGKTFEWREIAAERVNDVLATHSPVCWDCHILQTFCREHPDMSVDRSSISAGVQREVVQ